MANSELHCPNFPALQLVRTGRIVRFLGRLTLYLLIATIISMLFVPWQQTARGIGTVVALDPQQRPQPVLSPTKGIIDWVRPDLREGSYVEKGETLIRLQPLASEAVQQIKDQIREIDAAVTAAQASLSLQKENEMGQVEAGKQLNESLDAELKGAKEKYKQAGDELAIIKAELADKRNKLEVAAKVAERGIISGQEYFTLQREFEAATSKFQKAESALEEAAQDLNSKRSLINSKREDIQIKNQEARQKIAAEEQKVRKLNKDLIDLKNKLNEYARLEVPAPRSGYIQQWNGLEDSVTVKELDQLFIIVPDATDLAFEMRVTGNDIPLVHEGDPVRLQFEGWPAVQFVGWPSVAIGTFGGKVDRVFPTDDGKGYFRVIVVPDKHFEGEADWPDNRYLRQGVRANGWVLLRKVPLGYEIWRQLNGFPPVVADDEPINGKSDKAGKVKLPKA
ncbi:MAG: HlyD family efflux transporter periplasmic adaptor subunit [Aureliella sp.]